MLKLPSHTFHAPSTLLHPLNDRQYQTQRRAVDLLQANHINAVAMDASCSQYLLISGRLVTTIATCAIGIHFLKGVNFSTFFNDAKFSGR